MNTESTWLVPPQILDFITVLLLCCYYDHCVGTYKMAHKFQFTATHHCVYAKILRRADFKIITYDVHKSEWLNLSIYTMKISIFYSRITHKTKACLGFPK